MPLAKAKPKVWSADEDSAEVRFQFVDRTSAEGMTAASVRQLQAAAKAAKAAGLAQITVIAAKGSGHKSHFAGTEWDIQGFNSNGSMWSREQRVMVAEGARRAGANRFGLYGSGRTLHFGNGPPGFAENITWGAGGLTSGDASRRFTHPAEKAFAANVAAGQPFLAYDDLAEVAVTVPAQRAIDVQLASAKFTMPDLPKGKYGEEAVVTAAVSGNPQELKKAFDTVIGNATSAVVKGMIPLIGDGTTQEQAKANVEGYFVDLAEQHPEVAQEVKRVLDDKPEMWAAVPETAVEAFRKGFESLPEIPLAQAVGAVPMPRLRPAREPVDPATPAEAKPPVVAVQAAAREIELSNLRGRILDDRGLVRKGVKSEAVREVQRFLNAEGVTDRNGRTLQVDGNYGTRTKQAVIEYQKSRGLKADGIVGPRTFRQMAFDTMPAPRLRANGAISREAFNDRFDPGGQVGSGSAASSTGMSTAYDKERLDQDLLTVVAQDVFNSPQYARLTPTQKVAEFNAIVGTIRYWESPAGGAQAARELQGYVPKSAVAAPLASSTVLDPFGTKVAGKAQDRMTAYMTEDDLINADMLNVPVDPGIGEYRDGSGVGGGLLGGIVNTLDSVAASNRAFAERQRAADARDRERTIAQTAGTGQSAGGISMYSFQQRFEPAQQSSNAMYQYGGYSSGYGTNPNQGYSATPVSGGGRAVTSPTPSTGGGSRPTTSPTPSRQPSSTPSRNPTPVSGSGGGVTSPTPAGGGSSGAIRPTNSTSGPGRTERLGSV